MTNSNCQAIAKFKLTRLVKNRQVPTFSFAKKEMFRNNFIHQTISDPMAIIEHFFSNYVSSITGQGTGLNIETRLSVNATGCNQEEV